MFTFKAISDWMNAGKIFSCRVISYDRKRKSGGQVNYYEGKLVQGRDLQAGARAFTRAETLDFLVANGLPRDPKHRMWHTRNVRLYADGQPTSIIKKIHLPLIIEFNEQPVVP